MNYDELLKNTESKSVGINEKKPVVVKIREAGKKALIVAVVTTTALCATGCAKFNEKYGYSKQLANDYNREFKYEAKDIMEKYNLDPTASHTVIEYAVLVPELSEENISGFYQLLGQEESEKLVQLLGYSDWNDYLIKHNYVDNNGNPSFDKWKRQWIEDGEKRFVEGEKNHESKNSNNKR